MITKQYVLPWLVQFQANKIQGLFNWTFQGQITEFSRTKINAINRHSLTPFWLAKTLNGVDYDFYSFNHVWSHYFILISVLCKMATVTRYDLQLHLKSKITLFMHRNVLQILDRGWATFFSAKSYSFTENHVV